MKNFKLGWLVAAVAAAVLAACGGGGDGDQTPSVKYGKLVSFGDSLSDVGTYAVGVVAASGGGKYTINSVDSTGKNLSKNWTELLAAQMGVAAPCAAQTGLNSAPALGGPVPVVNHSGCFGYAQGGARVTELVGPGNAALLALGNADGALGQLTDPVLNQITRHLTAAGGAFAADDLVTVMAGANDLFMNIATLQAQVAAGMDQAAAATAAAQAMGLAGGQLAGYVKAMVVGKGAQRVVVINLGDASLTPSAAAQDAATRGLIKLLVTTFNDQLKSGLAGQDKVLLVDAFTVLEDEVAQPAQYGLSNATGTACDMTKVSVSLFCSAATLNAGDTSKYLFADATGHQTPYGYRLLAQLVTDNLLKKGWL